MNSSPFFSQQLGERRFPGSQIGMENKGVNTTWDPDLGVGNQACTASGCSALS